MSRKTGPIRVIPLAGIGSIHALCGSHPGGTEPWLLVTCFQSTLPCGSDCRAIRPASGRATSFNPRFPSGSDQLYENLALLH